MQLLDCIIGEAATEVNKGGEHVAESSEVTKEFFVVLCAWNNEFSRGAREVNFSKLGVARNACILLCSTADLEACFEDGSDDDAMGSRSEPLKQMRKADVDDSQWERFVGACMRDVKALSKCKDEENSGNAAMDRSLTHLMRARESEMMKQCMFILSHLSRAQFRFNKSSEEPEHATLAVIAPLLVRSG